MNLYLYNERLEKIDKISRFSSLIWVRRFNEAGEFELTIPANDKYVSLFNDDQFLIREDDETIMLVEKIILPEDNENGDYLIVSGRSAEVLLDRRVNISRLPIGSYNGVYNAQKPMFEKNVLIGAGEQRKIDLIEYADDYDVNDPIVKQKLFISSDRLGESVYENTKETAKVNEKGFEFIKHGLKLQFRFYNGVDRSRKQSINPRVIFSPDFGNIIKSEYSLDTKKEKNSALVAGEGEGAERKTVLIGAETGLKRKEMFVDARDLSSTSGDVAMTEAEYLEALKNRGSEKISEARITETFDCEIDITRTYQYKKDFFVGDVVTCVNKYGLQANSRIAEISEFFDENGYEIVPKVEGVKEV